MLQPNDPDLGHETNDHEAHLAQANKLFQTGHMLIHGKRKSVDKAIKCIQKAISLIDSDYRYWNLLGEAYFQRGSLNPSINCFTKSLAYAEKLEHKDEEEKRQIQDHCTHSRLRMSDIRLSVSLLDEAADGYIEIINENPNYVAALVGLSKVELQRAKNCFYSGLVKSGHTHCMNALEYALKGIKIDPSTGSHWKLASDCCLTQFIHGQRGTFATKIKLQFPGGDQDDLTITRYSCIEMAQQLLCKAIALEQSPKKSAYLWHNLGISLYLKSTIVTASQEREILLKRSLRCILKALKHEHTSSEMRNSIGVVAFCLNYPNIAQSFLIKSIQKNTSTSEMQFSNLGYFYLQKGENQLASIAFGRSQAEEPLYYRSWLGNALVNERNNLNNLSPLRHCHRLENNFESQIMYATKVTSLPLTDEYTKDHINALDCMKRIINYHPASVEVNNTLGLIYERCGFYDQAKLYFDIANKLAPQDSRVIFNKLRQHNALKSCFCQDQSIQVEVDFIVSAEELASRNNREYTLNFIYYLFNNGDFNGVRPLMSKLMERFDANDGNSKLSARILLALAAKAENGDFKRWLLKNLADTQNIIICLEALVNMLCLMILGSTTNDGTLVEQIYPDLKSYLVAYLSTRTKQFSSHFYSLEGSWTRLVLLSSIYCLADRGKFVRTLVALYPTIADLWLYLGLSLMFKKTSQQMAIHCITKASLIGSTQSDLCVICDILLAVLVQQVKSKSPSNDNLDRRINYLSRAVFKKPNQELLRKALRDSVDLKGKNLPKRSPRPDGNDSGLYELALDLMIKSSLNGISRVE